MEIAEQLNWEIPDRVFISVGDGCCIGGLYKGFRDLLDLGLTERMPKITGVQAVGSSPIFRAIIEKSQESLLVSRHYRGQYLGRSSEELG